MLDIQQLVESSLSLGSCLASFLVPSIPPFTALESLRPSTLLPLLLAHQRKPKSSILKGGSACIPPVTGHSLPPDLLESSDS